MVSKRFLLILAFVVTIFFMAALWALDLSVTVLMSGDGGYLTNGFLIMDPVQMYHICVYSLVFSMFVLICIIIESLALWTPKKSG